MKYPGLNIQFPWSRLLLSGEKTIETRTYPLPGRYVNQGFWLIETPGKRGKFKARVIAKIRFSSFKQYQSASDFYTDSHLHKIKEDDPDYGWKEDVAKYGWIVGDVEGVNEFRPPSPRGIVYTSPFGLEAGI